MTFGTNLDYRYAGGSPTIEQVQQFGIRIARYISLPENEYQAENTRLAGCRGIAVYTGESENAGKYVMQNAGAIQIGNEPFMGGGATWPAGDAQAMVDTWLRVRDVVWAKHGEWFPLIGPGLWVQDYAKWATIANRLEGITAAAAHVYPEPSGQSELSVRNLLARYRNVRPDIPLICTEWSARWPNVLPIARAIDTYCSARLWYTWDDPGQPHHRLIGTPELGILAAAA